MDFRQRLEQSRVHLVGANDPADEKEPITCNYFASERGANPSCLDLRFADGNRIAFPYSFVTGISFDGDLGIEILTTQKCITIKGRNLMALYEALVAYRVRYVQADLGTDTQDDGLFVATISVEEL